MPLAETIIFGSIASVFTIFGFALFRMEDDKRDKLDVDLTKAYQHLRNFTLDPILQGILSSTKGKFKPEKFFNTPEVIEKLEQYRVHLFKFNEVSNKKEIIILLLKFSANTSIVLGFITFLFTAVNELFINSEYNTIGISTLYIAVLNGVILVVGLIFLVSFIQQFRSSNSSFKSEIRELRGGLE